MQYVGCLLVAFVIGVLLGIALGVIQVYADAGLLCLLEVCIP